MPADHEARSLIKRRQLQENAEASLNSQNSQPSRRPRAGERQESSAHVKEVMCESDKRGPCSSARNAQHMKQRDRDTRSANEVRETRGSSITQWCWTTQWQSIPESFLEVSRPSCGKLPHWRRTSDYAVAEHYTAVLE